MNTLETYGEALLQQHEGNRQLASALVNNVRALGGRSIKLLVAVRQYIAGKYPLR